MKSAPRQVCRASRCGRIVWVIVADVDAAHSPDDPWFWFTSECISRGCPACFTAVEHDACLALGDPRGDVVCSVLPLGDECIIPITRTFCSDESAARASVWSLLPWSCLMVEKSASTGSLENLAVNTYRKPERMRNCVHCTVDIVVSWRASYVSRDMNALLCGAAAFHAAKKGRNSCSSHINLKIKQFIVENMKPSGINGMYLSSSGELNGILFWSRLTTWKVVFLMLCMVNHLNIISISSMVGRQSSNPKMPNLRPYCKRYRKADVT